MKIVLAAIRRWEEQGLVTSELAGRLRAEVQASSAALTRRLFQYVLAATGAVILVIAGGVFLDWAWPRMTEALRAGTLALGGVLAYAAGLPLERRRGWTPVAYLTESAGMVLVLIAMGYSERAWYDGSTGGRAVAVSGMLAPLLSAWRLRARTDVLPALHLAASLLFLGVALDRATFLDLAAVVWIMDGVLAAVFAALVYLLVRDPEGLRNRWALNAFTVALYAGFFLVFMTGGEALRMGDDAVYAIDAWLAVMAAVTVYGIHWAPPGLRRGWFALQLALVQLVWVGLGFASTVGVADGPPESALVAVGGSGVVGLLYARRHQVPEILATSAISLVAGTWYWGVERAGALGAVLALVAAAALLFWFSGREGAGQVEA